MAHRRPRTDCRRRRPGSCRNHIRGLSPDGDCAEAGGCRGWGLGAGDPDHSRFNLVSGQAGEADRHVRDFDDRFAVGKHQGVDNRKGLRAVTELLDADLVGDGFGGFDDLATAFQTAVDTGNRLAPGRAVFTDPAHAQQVDPQGVHAALVHQRAGHDMVVTEVAGQKPVPGIDIHLGANLAETVTTALRIEFNHAVDQLQVASRQGVGTLEIELGKQRAEGLAEIAGIDRIHLLFAVRFLLQRQPGPASHPGRTPGCGSRSSLVWTIPCPAASSCSVKKPAQPFFIDNSGSPLTVPSKLKRNR